MRHQDKNKIKQTIWIGPLLLVVGVLIGSLADPMAWLERRFPEKEKSETGVEQLDPQFRPSDTVPTTADNGLKTLNLKISPTHASIIQNVINRAKERDLIIQDAGDTVPATLGYEGKDHPVEIRIKGDWTDHIKTSKVSFRIRLLDSKLLGMRVFSIQNPETRGYMWEWLVLQAARMDNMLAPRSMFVNVNINNNPCGVYFLEEHFNKELLESQGRREGPIVRFDESGLWSMYLQYYHGALGVHSPIPLTMIQSMGSARAATKAYGEKRLASVETLNRTLMAGLEKIRKFQSCVIAESPLSEKLEKLQAVTDLAGETLEQVFDTYLFAKAHALASLFQIRHGTVWNNERYYFNPLTDRLEPVFFDNGAQHHGIDEPIIFKQDPAVKALASCKNYFLNFFPYLGGYCKSAYVHDLFKKLKPEMEMIQAALTAEAPLASNYRMAPMKQRLLSHQIHLKKMLYPVDPINFDCFFQKTSENGSLLNGICEINAWSTTRMPVLVKGFRFSNNAFVSALSCLEKKQGMNPFVTKQGVVLPGDGRRVSFRFPADSRLANLSNISQIKKEIRNGEQDKGGIKLNRITGIYAMLAGGEEKAELLYLRPYDRAWKLEEGRPSPPGLEQALKAHPFLAFDLEKDLLQVQPGQWDVKGDLIVPEGYALNIPPGVTLRFEAKAALVAQSPLIFKGTKEAPIRLTPQKGLAFFGGIIVLNAKAPSLFEHVVVQKTRHLERSGWVTTGGITFYHSPVTLNHTRIDTTLAEDGLNVFGAELTMNNVSFLNCASDSFDGDFVTGTIQNCVFQKGGADGADFSGSDVILRNCRFVDLVDKGISVGEKTKCRIIGGLVKNCSIGLAVKDLSQVTVEGLKIVKVQNFAIASYIKKSEYGPCTVIGKNIQIPKDLKTPFLNQTGCSLTVNGKKIPPQEVDVEKMYEQNILGK